VAEEASQLCSQERDCEYYYHEPDEALSWQSHSHGFRVSARSRKLEMARESSNSEQRGVLVSQSLYYIACKCNASRDGGVLA
jgi:hypothetical protein